MGLLDKMKDAVKNIEIPIALEKVKYVGGCIEYDKEFEGNLYVYKDKLILEKGITSKYEIKLDNVQSVEFKTHEQISKDVTLTRLLLVGVFAFGLKKKSVEKTSYAIINTADDQNIMLMSENANKIVNTIKKAKGAV